MKHFLVIGCILLFCFGILPEFFSFQSVNNNQNETGVEINEDDKNSETENEDIQDVDSVFLYTDTDKKLNNGDNANSSKNTIDEEKTEGEVDNNQSVKIKNWINYPNGLAFEENSNMETERVTIKNKDNTNVNSNELPIEEKMINEHKQERANKEIPGTNKIENLEIVNLLQDFELESESELVELLKVIDNATVVMQDGIVNVKVGV